jgi:uncharacterized protein
MKKFLLLVSMTLACSAFAQSSAAKKELIAKVLQLQQPAIETMARMMAEQPAVQVSQRANAVLQQQIPPDKRAAIAKEIQGDLRKYVEESVPIVRDRALRLAPTTIGAILEEKFTEDELKQLIAIIESPVNRKFLQLGGEMQKSLNDKLVAETRPSIEPKVRAMEIAVAAHLGLPVTAPAAQPGGGTARPPARAASN